jgi:hypothetical protein
LTRFVDVAVTCDAPFTYEPTVALVTATLTVHVDAPAAAFTPVPPMANVVPPAVAVTVGVPPQLFVTAGVAAMTKLVGSASVKVMPLRDGAPAGFVTVNVNVDVCPTPMVLGLNAFVSVGFA